MSVGIAAANTAVAISPFSASSPSATAAAGAGAGARGGGGGGGRGRPPGGRRRGLVRAGGGRRILDGVAARPPGGHGVDAPQVVVGTRRLLVGRRHLVGARLVSAHLVGVRHLVVVRRAGPRTLLRGQPDHV